MHFRYYLYWSMKHRSLLSTNSKSPASDWRQIRTLILSISFFEFSPFKIFSLFVRVFIYFFVNLIWQSVWLHWMLVCYLSQFVFYYFFDQLSLVLISLQCNCLKVHLFQFLFILFKAYLVLYVSFFNALIGWSLEFFFFSAVCCRLFVWLILFRYLLFVWQIFNNGDSIQSNRWHCGVFFSFLCLFLSLFHDLSLFARIN